MGRLNDNEDDELAFAYYIANGETTPYNRQLYTQTYGKAVYSYYKRYHVDRGAAMFCKALGITTRGLFQKGLSFVVFKMLSSRAQAYARNLSIPTI